MTRLLGVLLMVLIVYTVLMGSFAPARSLNNHQTLAERLGYYGIPTLGVGVLIVSGGIDLSIGSLLGLIAVYFGLLLSGPLSSRQTIPLAVCLGLDGTLLCYALLPAVAVPPRIALLLSLLPGAGLIWVCQTYLPGLHSPPWLAMLLMLGFASQIGLFHGLLITRLHLQPFLVTLCGLFMYRGLARWLSPGALALPSDEQVVALRAFLVSDRMLGFPHILLLMVLVALVLAVVLHGSIYGRYWFAIGNNEQAARYAGIATQRQKIAAYMICSTLAGLGGLLFLLMYRNATPSSAGSLLELYAITGAVLGGCNLRGGEGTIPGIVLGAAVLPLLQQICTYNSAIGSDLEYTVVGGALLLATIANELVTRWSKRR
ncbi:MAG TPA: ABC transporter permease [Gemmataceae bacterium]|jgi:ribose transport system permease protein